MTEIEFPEHFDAESHACYGIDERAVESTVREPSATELLHFRTKDEPTAVYFRAAETEQILGLVVIAQCGDERVLIHDALPVPREVDVEKKTPLGILAELCRRYGLRMRMGSHEGTLLKGVSSYTAFASSSGEFATEIEILTKVPEIKAPGSVRVLIGEHPDGRPEIQLVYAINPDWLLAAVDSG